MHQLALDAYAHRKPLRDLLQVPERVQSVYSLTQHVWAGESDADRQRAKKENRVRLETLDEFFLDPVRSYLSRILERVAEGEGQGFWVQAEFGVGKSHLLAATAVIAVGGAPAWDRVKVREDAERRAGPGARLDTLWRKRIEKKRLFPVVFSLEGVGGGHEKRLEDFILDEAQATFALREGKPLAVYPEEHLAHLYLREHARLFGDDLRAFLGDRRLTRGLPQYEYDELLKALRDPSQQRDAGRLLTAFYRHKNLSPHVPTERGERIARAVRDILDAGYSGVFIAIDEMSEYLRRSQYQADDEDCLLALSSTLAKAQGLPVWTLVAAQAAHSNPMKIIGPDRLREELLEHKAERFRDIVAQRTRTIQDTEGVQTYYKGLKSLLPWVKDTSPEEFESCFPFPPDAIQIIRSISTKLTGTRSTISFLHSALQRAVREEAKDLVPLWRVFGDLMSYNEMPSTASSGAMSIRNRFRGEVAALEAAQATLARITDGQLARPQNRSRAERILNTLFLYHLAGVPGLTREQILDAVCDLRPNEDELEGQLGHYETILDDMRSKLRNQIRLREGRFEFIPKESGQYDDLVYQATERLKADPTLFWQYVDRAMNLTHPDVASPFADFVGSEDGRQVPVKVTWHGQERSGRTMAADLTRPNARPPEIDTHGSEDDFIVVLSRRPLSDKEVQAFLKRDAGADPRVCVWAPSEPTEQEKSALCAVLAHLLVAEEGRETAIEKDAQREFKREAHRAHAAMQGMYGRGAARTARTSLEITLLRGVPGAVTAMAEKAMDTCYASRSIDFSPRKFDAAGAVKLINGLVKLGRAVGEGDQLWSAVENFATPLGLVRQDDLRQLDPSGSGFYQAIRKKVEERGGAGLEVRTVYNWFTGYDPKDGKESPGLTRRMVDVYLLALAQQGVIRISDRRGAWIDRATVAGIEFKPETLRGLTRIELPRALDDWPVFSPYLEVLLGKREGSLGPKYDKASADDALYQYWSTAWVRHPEVSQAETNLRELFRTLDREADDPFDELLLYWLRFADEPRPPAPEPDAVFDALRRAVLHTAEESDSESLTSTHLSTFRESFRQLRELFESFEATRSVLLRAARLARAPIPEKDKRFKEVLKAQKELLAELENAAELVVSPSTVQTRLQPRLSRLEQAYVPAYLDELVALSAAQDDLEEAAATVKKGDEMRVLRVFQELPEAQRAMQQVQDALAAAPARLRPKPEDRDSAARDVQEVGYVSDRAERAPLPLPRLQRERKARECAKTALVEAAQRALLDVAAFIRSPRIVESLRGLKGQPAAVTAILTAETEQDLVEALLTAGDADLESLARAIAAALGGKAPKQVPLATFVPSTDYVWDRSDLDTVVADFRRYLESAWEEGRYLKLER